MGRNLVPLVLQCCLGPHSHGLPFGTVVSQRKGAHLGRDIVTFSEHIDWARFLATPPDNLPSNAYKAGQSCLVLLLLFIAFPDLKRVCSQTNGGNCWNPTNTPSPVGVGVTAGGIGAIYCRTIEKQTSLRALLPDFAFASDVNSLDTFAMHLARGAADTAAAAMCVPSLHWSCRGATDLGSA